MLDGFRHLAAIGVQLAQLVAQLRQLDFKLAEVACLRESVQITFRGKNSAPLRLALRVADGAKVERIGYFEEAADLDAPRNFQHDLIVSAGDAAIPAFATRNVVSGLRLRFAGRQ